MSTTCIVFGLVFWCTSIYYKITKKFDFMDRVQDQKQVLFVQYDTKFVYEIQSVYLCSMPVYNASKNTTRQI